MFLALVRERERERERPWAFKKEKWGNKVVVHLHGIGY